MNFKNAAQRMVRNVHYGLNQLHYGLVLAPMGKGAPLSKELWDMRYEEGYSENQLRSLNDFARYMIIAGYIRTLCNKPRILDVGCGDGILVEMMPSSSFDSYLGIDLSAEAIKRAEAPATHKAAFEICNFEEWTPAEKFDVIVFNETLYYATDPVALVSKYAMYLHEGGLMIVSMCRFLHHPVMLWRKLGKRFETVDSTAITTHKGELYNVKVFRKRV